MLRRTRMVQLHDTCLLTTGPDEAGIGTR